jgi:hypothetical protein
MAGPLNLKLLADFFNKIDPERRLLRDSNTSEIEGIAEVAGERSKRC